MVQVIRRSPESNNLSDAIIAATSGFLQGRKLRQEREDSALSNAYKLAQIEELKRKTQAFGAPAPSGYIRDPYSGKLVEDLSGVRTQDTNGLEPKTWGKTGRPTAYYNPKRDLEYEIQKKELSKMAEALPKLEQAAQATGQLKELYGKSGEPIKINSNVGLGLGLPAALWTRLAQGGGRRIMAEAGANPELKQYIGNRGAFAGLLSKGAFGEAGMLTNQDINRIKKILPSEYSTEQEASVAWKEIGQILTSARKRFENKKAKSLGAELPFPEQEEFDKRLLSNEFWDSSVQEKNNKKTNIPQKTKSFETPEDADNSGLPSGTIVLVQGRRYKI